MFILSRDRGGADSRRNQHNKLVVVQYAVRESWTSCGVHEHNEQQQQHHQAKTAEPGEEKMKKPPAAKKPKGLSGFTPH